MDERQIKCIRAPLSYSQTERDTMTIKASGQAASWYVKEMASIEYLSITFTFAGRSDCESASHTNQHQELESVASRVWYIRCTQGLVVTRTASTLLYVARNLNCSLRSPKMHLYNSIIIAPCMFCHLAGSYIILTKIIKKGYPTGYPKSCSNQLTLHKTDYYLFSHLFCSIQLLLIYDSCYCL